MQFSRPESERKSLDVLKHLHGHMLDYEYKGLWEASEEEERANCQASDTDPADKCLFRFLAQLGLALRMEVCAFMGFNGDAAPVWILPEGKTLTDPQKAVFAKLAELSLLEAIPLEVVPSNELTESFVAPVEEVLGATTMLACIPLYSAGGDVAYGVVFLTHPAWVPSPTFLEWDLSFFYQLERMTPIGKMFAQNKLPCVVHPTVPNPRLYPHVRWSGVQWLDVNTMDISMRDAVRRNTIDGIATWINSAAKLVGYKEPHGLKVNHLFDMIEHHSSKAEAESVSKTASQSADSISQTASQNPWEQTLPTVLETMAVSFQQTPAVYWVVANLVEGKFSDANEIDGVSRFTIQHNAGIPTPTPEESAAICAISHWAGMMGESVYIDPAKPFDPYFGVGPLVTAVQKVLGADIPVIVIPVYGFKNGYEDEQNLSNHKKIEKPIFHGVFVGLREPGAKAPSVAQGLMWNMMAQYLLAPMATAKLFLKMDYRPVDIMKAILKTKKQSRDLVIPVWAKL